MTPLDLRLALSDVRDEVDSSLYTAMQRRYVLLYLMDNADMLSAIIKRLDLDMHPSPEYAKKVPRALDIPENQTALGILQGRGARAQEVTAKKVSDVKADYNQRLEAETKRRNEAGIPLTGTIAPPTVVSRDHPAFKPPWER